jgi:hypothetical protein
VFYPSDRAISKVRKITPGHLADSREIIQEHLAEMQWAPLLMQTMGNICNSQSIRRDRVDKDPCSQSDDKMTA